MAGNPNGNIENAKEIQHLQRLQSSKLLPVGCGFRPTDVELVAYYLSRRNGGLLQPVDRYLVTEFDVYSCDPWELPGKSLFQLGDPVWHFFSRKYCKYPSGRRYNHPTKSGQWVFTRNERDIALSPGSRVIGKKRTLIFYVYRKAEIDIKDIWAMHEYHTTNDQDEFVLCRLLKKPLELLLQKESHSHANMEPSTSRHETNDAEKQSLNAKLTTHPNRPALPSSQQHNSITRLCALEENEGDNPEPSSITIPYRISREGFIWPTPNQKKFYLIPPYEKSQGAG